MSKKFSNKNLEEIMKEGIYLMSKKTSDKTTDEIFSEGIMNLKKALVIGGLEDLGKNINNEVKPNVEKAGRRTTKKL